MKNKKSNLNTAFTLIELLVVISIIGLLASVILVALNGTRAKARDTKRVADLNQLSKALELYFNTYFTYPTSSAGALSSFKNTLGTPGIASTGPTQIITALPIEPLPADGTCNPSGPGSNQYYWEASNAGNTTGSYALTFCLGNQTGALIPGPHTLTQAGFQ